MRRFLFVALLFPLQVLGAPPVQQTMQEGFVVSPTIALNSVGATHTLVLQILAGGSTQSITSITDSSGNTVSPCAAFSGNNANNPGGAVYYVANASSGTHTLTVNLGESGGQSEVLALAEYSDIVATSPCDVGGTTATGDTTTPTTNSITPTQSGDLVVAFVGQNGAGSTFSGWTNSFTQEDFNNSGGISTAWAQITQGTATAISTAATTSSIGYWAATIAAFKTSGGGGVAPKFTMFFASLLIGPQPGEKIQNILNGCLGSFDPYQAGRDSGSCSQESPEPLSAVLDRQALQQIGVRQDLIERGNSTKFDRRSLVIHRGFSSSLADRDGFYASHINPQNLTYAALWQRTVSLEAMAH